MRLLPQTLPATTRAVRRLALAAALLAGPALSGCNLIGYIGRDRGEPKPVDVEAAYRDLDGRRVAVLVAVPPDLRYGRSRTAGSTPTRPVELLLQAMHQAIADGIPTAELLPRPALEVYMKDHPHWSLRPARQVLDALGVERLVSVDVSTFRLREPGNAEIWKGRLDGVVNVFAADAADPDERVFSERVSVEFPRNSTFGVTNADARTIQLGLLRDFTIRGAGFFYDHKR